MRPSPPLAVDDAFEFADAAREFREGVVEPQRVQQEDGEDQREDGDQHPLQRLKV